MSRHASEIGVREFLKKVLDKLTPIAFSGSICRLVATVLDWRSSNTSRKPLEVIWIYEIPRTVLKPPCRLRWLRGSELLAATAGNWLRTVSVVLLLVGFAGTALGQTPGVDLPIRIGALLPAVPEPGGAPFDFAVAEAARLAAEMAADEFGFNAEILGLDFALLTEHAVDSEALLEAAGRLIDEEGVFALLGGFGTEQALGAKHLGRGTPDPLSQYRSLKR